MRLGASASTRRFPKFGPVGGAKLYILMLVLFLILSIPLGSRVAQAQSQGQAQTVSATPTDTGPQNILQQAGDNLVSVVAGVSQWAATGDDQKKTLEFWRDAFSSPSACWGCELYVHMDTITKAVGKQGQDLFAPGAIAALNAFTSLWVVFQLYLLASPTHANSPAQSINTIFQRIMLMFILWAILAIGPYEMIMVDLVDPTLAAVMTAGQSLIGGAPNCSVGGGGSVLATAGSSLICSMHTEMGQGMGLGAFLIDDAKLTFLGEFELIQVLGGLVLVVCFGWMMIMLPFRLFDAMIRIAVVTIILPVIVLAYQFKPTRGICKQAVTSVLAAMLTYLFTAIAVAISTRLLQAVTSDVFKELSNNSAQSYIGPIDANSFMILVASAVGMAAFVKQAATLAGEFAGFQGSMGNVGNAGAGAVAGAAAATAVGGGFAAAKAAGMSANGAKYLAGKAMTSIKAGSAQQEK